MMTSECSEDGYDWTNWINQDDPSMSGDWETVASYSDGDVCDRPIAVEAQKVRARIPKSEIVIPIPILN